MGSRNPSAAAASLLPCPGRSSDAATDGSSRWSPCSSCERGSTGTPRTEPSHSGRRACTPPTPWISSCACT
uniref:Uncharacterized protein n=1 Tax=Arundo donax TaxID=35708 RepID=A0A0A9CRS9_ARUDO